MFSDAQTGARGKEQRAEVGHLDRLLQFRQKAPRFELGARFPAVSGVASVLRHACSDPIKHVW